MKKGVQPVPGIFSPGFPLLPSFRCLVIPMFYLVGMTAGAAGSVCIQTARTMANRRVIKSCSSRRNFLGTYTTSRYTDYEGYWLPFGLLPGDIGQLTFDLLAQGGNSDVSPLTAAEQWATMRFADQV